MKTFNLIALISTVANSASLEEVYGPVTEVANILPWHKRTPTLVQNPSSAYYEVRQPGNCVFPLNVVLVQDATNSFQDDVQAMVKNQLGQMISALEATHPESNFGLVTFRDKPLDPFGSPGDFCQRFDVPLTTNTALLNQSYSKLVAAGGLDAPENQYGALIAATQDTRVGWTSGIATNLVVLSTDAVPHFADDGRNLASPLPPWTGYNQSTASADCTRTYYPAPNDVREALIGRQAYLASLIFDGDQQKGLVARAWEWVNSYIGQTPDFIEPLADDASDFWLRLQNVIRAIEETECEMQSTTPAPPVSTTIVPTPPTTTTTTTTTSSYPGEEECKACCMVIPCDPELGPCPPGPCKPELGPCPPAPCNPNQGPCPPSPCPEGCPPCPCPARDGVLIKLAHRPKRMHLEVEN